MTYIICPLFPEAFYKYTIDLSSETYTLSFRWNDRLEHWVMDMEDAEGVLLFQGVTLVPVYPLISQLALEKPTGEFYLIPIDKTKPYIVNPRELYQSHSLVYLEDK